MSMFRYVLAAMILFAFAGPALADSECQVRVVHTVTDDIGNVWQPGKLLPATILRRQAGQVFYCAHGGGCVPSTIKDEQAVQLMKCRVGPSIGNGDYRLIPTPQ